ncbi:von Willebrand factor type A domain protein [Cooperia oncophora]
MVMRSELYQRGLCSFEYYSDPFQCQTESLEFSIYGIDENNQQFRRMEQFFCIDHGRIVTTVAPNVTAPVTVPVVPTTQPIITPTQSSPVVSTSPGDHLTTAVTMAPPTVYQFDILFLIDVSQEAQNRLDDMNSFVTLLMSGYDVSQQNARVALMAVGSGALGAIPLANFNTISSYQNLLNYVNTVSTYTDFGDPGQALGQALNIAVNNDFMQSGYRTNLKNHVIVYVTATSKFDDQPQPLAQKIRSAGSYGIITVGYGPLVTDPNALQGISGGASCSFIANDSPGLMDQVAAVKLLINKADTNGGKYC